MTTLKHILAAEQAAGEQGSLQINVMNWRVSTWTSHSSSLKFIFLTFTYKILYLFSLLVNSYLRINLPQEHECEIRATPWTNKNPMIPVSPVEYWVNTLNQQRINSSKHRRMEINKLTYNTPPGSWEQNLRPSDPLYSVRSATERSLLLLLCWVT